MVQMLASLASLAIFAVACTDTEAAARPSDGALVLEVGGAHPSLRAVLLAHGVSLAPPQYLREPDGLPSPATAEGPSNQLAGNEEGPAPTPAPPDPLAEEAFVIVKLGRGQTLIHLAKKHLGDGNRFRELLLLNGWTEDDARRLREDEPVKVPRRPGADGASSRR